jgi:hypothetical protein
MIRTIALLMLLVMAQSAAAQQSPPAAPAPKPAAKAKQPAPKADGAKATETATGGRCIGVISHLGPFQVQQVGIVVFGNDLKEEPLPGLDDLVVARVRAAAGPGIAVRKVGHAPAAFLSFDGPDRPLFRNLEEDLAAIVRRVAQGAACERYVVVTRYETKFWNTNQTIRGVGVVTYGEGRKTYLFALAFIRVYDGRSFAVLKKGPGGGRPDLGTSMFGTGISGPARDLGTGPWPPTAAAMASMRDGARSLLTQSLDQALPALLAP